jgi:protein farnesyltransferase subunit beta
MLACRGAYCATVLIKLLDLPVELTPESPAFREGSPTLFTGLADWVRKCR